jgi:YVTN family beta-propeller protein
MQPKLFSPMPAPAQSSRMPRLTTLLVMFAVFFLGCAPDRPKVTPAAAATGPAVRAGYLSPGALAISPDGRTLFIGLATAHQVALFDTAARRITRTITVPGEPLGLALSSDGMRLYVTCAAPSSVVAVIDTRSARVTAQIPAGHTAMAPVLSPDGRTLFVCNRFNNDISVIDLQARRELARIPVAREPVAAAITPCGNHLLVANHIHAGRADVDFVGATVSVIDTASRSVAKEIILPNGSSLLRGIAISPDGRHAAVSQLLARFHLPTTQIERGWINSNGISLIDLETMELIETVLLDNIDSGAGNPWAVEWTRDGRFLCVTHAGTHEVSVVDAGAMFEKLERRRSAQFAGPVQGYRSPGAGGVAVRDDLSFISGIRQRIKLAGNGPRALAISGTTVYVANYFSDGLSIIDLDRPMSAESVSLGGPVELSIVRRGEMHFNDASLSFQGWQSCASCHSSDGRVDGLNWDNLNDGIGNPKNVRSLLLSHQTPPSMALGVRESAEVAVRAGIRNSLFTVQPEEVAEAMDEYLKALKPIPSPHLVNGQLSPAALRGKELFMSSEVGCAECHRPDLFTNLKSYDVGTTGPFDKPTDRFDTPTLVEVWLTAPYLHDGSAVTVREVIRDRNPEDRHGYTSHLSEQQIDDLTEYVLSL